MAGSGRGAVFLACAGNGALTVLKFGAYLFSGSGAMLSEAIHSAADTMNQLLLYVGIKRSLKPATTRYPYGYGVERYFFALLSAIGIFFLGCGVTIYHGVEGLLHPREIQPDFWTYAVLAISFIVEGFVLWAAWKSVLERKGEQPFWRFVRTSSDPTLLAVLFEDLVACLGVLVAAAGIAISAWTGNSIFDALSSILIGVMLGVVAIALGYRNRELILGPAMPPDREQEIVAFLEGLETVTSVQRVKTRLVAAGRFRLVAEVDYDGHVLARRELEWFRTELQREGANPDRVAEQYGERVVDSLAREIDRIEKELTDRFPDLAWTDLESHWAEE